MMLVSNCMNTFVIAVIYKNTLSTNICCTSMITLLMFPDIKMNISLARIGCVIWKVLILCYECAVWILLSSTAYMFFQYQNSHMGNAPGWGDFMNINSNIIKCFIPAHIIYLFANLIILWGLAAIIFYYWSD